VGKVRSLGRFRELLAPLPARRDGILVPLERLWNLQEFEEGQPGRRVHWRWWWRKKRGWWGCECPSFGDPCMILYYCLFKFVDGGNLLRMV